VTNPVQEFFIDNQYRIFFDYYYNWLISAWPSGTQIASRHKYNKSIIAVAFSDDVDDIFRPEDESFLLDINKEKWYFDRVWDLTHDLHLDFVNKLREKGPIFCLEFAAVLPKYRNRGISTGLLQELLQVAQKLIPQKHFHTVFGECITTISYELCVKLGFTCIRELMYKDWEYPKGSEIYPLAEYDKLRWYNAYRLVIKSIT